MTDNFYKDIQQFDGKQTLFEYIVKNIIDKAGDTPYRRINYVLNGIDTYSNIAIAGNYTSSVEHIYNLIKNGASFGYVSEYIARYTFNKTAFEDMMI